MRKLWLPVTGEPRNRLCRLCRTHVTETEYASHVRGCYSRNEAEIRMSSLRERAPHVMGDAGIDLEYENHWRRRRHAS